jgi:hypothetical protein
MAAGARREAQSAKRRAGSARRTLVNGLWGIDFVPNLFIIPVYEFVIFSDTSVIA